MSVYRWDEIAEQFPERSKVRLQVHYKYQVEASLWNNSKGEETPEV